MTIFKTIGGDRLGSGKKMKQAMHNYERSNHDLSYIWRSSMAPGVLVPFMKEYMQQSDTFDITLNTEALTHPTIAPLFGSYKMQLDVFLCPIRLYQAQLHNNKLGIGMDMSKIKLPQLEYRPLQIDWDSEIPVDIQQINPSSLLAYLGTRGCGHYEDGTSEGLMQQNALPYLMYWDIYKNYYANKQEEIGAYINYPDIPTPTTVKAIYERKNTVISDYYTLPYAEEVQILQQDKLHFTLKNYKVENAQTRVHIGSVYATTNLIKMGEIIEKKINEDGTISYVLQFNSVYHGNYIAAGATIEWDREGLSPDAYIPVIDTFPLKNLDDMREDILADIKNTSAFIINNETYAPYGNPLENLTYITTKFGIRSMLPMEGLALKTYQSDKFNNWMSTEWIEGTNGIAEITAVDVSQGSLKLDALNLAQKVYNMLNRIALSGGTYYDWIEAVYGETAVHQAETPMYMGGLSKEIVFQEVISNSATEDEPLGTLAGRGRQSGKHKGGELTIKATEPSYCMGIISLTPRLDYSQGNDWDINIKTMDDWHKPELDGIGYQDLITDQLAAWDTRRSITPTAIYKSAGKQPAWINYMTNVNKTYGNFADSRNEMFMTLNRRYEVDAEHKTIKDLTTYIDPSKFNYTFAQTDIAAQNFWIQIAVNINARRKISARQIPNL